MTPFACLLDRLVYTPGRNEKLRLLAAYFRAAPDPDRGWALAALTGNVRFRHIKPSTLRGLIGEVVDPVLFDLSYDYVGDLAETCALLWPAAATADAPRLSEAVADLNTAGRLDAPRRLAALLDRLDPTERWALLKLVTGGLRIGVSARLARTALAQAFDRPLDDIEEIWHGVAPPYAALFDWLAGHAEKPDLGAQPVFRPFMLAHPLDDGPPADLADWQVEWKWDGIRVQAVAVNGARRLYARSGDDISAAFPDIIDAMTFEGVVDGELLVGDPGGDPAPFSDLQKRLNRKTVNRKLLAEHPAFVCAYDLLFTGTEDVRPRPLAERRPRLRQFLENAATARFVLSEALDVADHDALAALQAGARAAGREGLMLKRRDSAYRAGRIKGLWHKWKRDPLTADAVLMYAQRGHGKRSSFYSDFTFGVWRADELVPVGKAYFGFTDNELAQLDRWVRTHAVNRFGPVTEVEKQLVFEVAFDSVQPSRRHKSGLAMRFPRIGRIRWDKPAAEADRLETLEKLAQ